MGLSSSVYTEYPASSSPRKWLSWGFQEVVKVGVSNAFPQNTEQVLVLSKFQLYLQTQTFQAEAGMTTSSTTTGYLLLCKPVSASACPISWLPRLSTLFCGRHACFSFT